MKGLWIVLTLVASILFVGNSTSFAQNDTKTKSNKKEETLKKVDAKKEDLLKKKDSQKEKMIKQKDDKKEDMIKKEDAKKEELIKKEDSKKDSKIVKVTGKDKVVGKTDDGKAIYEGPKGGRYTINDKGKKVYLNKEK